MSTARIVINSANNIHRFLRCETSNDGSLIIFVDKKAKASVGARRLNNQGDFVEISSASEKEVPYARYSIHTTGEVHGYSDGKRVGTIYIEPLDRISIVHAVAYISIPSATYFEKFRPEADAADAVFTLTTDVHADERLNFIVGVGPNPLPEASPAGLALTYETYSILISPSRPIVEVPNDMEGHIISGMPAKGAFERRQTEKAQAELAFFKKAYAGLPPIYREDSGAYVIHAEIPMRTAPKLVLEFDRPDLSIEIFPYGSPTEPVHKIRFWINDKGGKNKIDDLRRHIVSVALDARM